MLWRPSVVLRIILGISGVIALIVGIGLWALETEYGGEGVCGSETIGSVTRVFDCPGEQADAEGHLITTIVFEGTEAEALEFMDQRSSEGRNYLIPGLIFAVGAILLIGAVLPPIGKREDVNPSEEIEAG